MEDNEGAEEAKEDMKLGKLQFSIDYDFQKGEVMLIRGQSNMANVASNSLFLAVGGSGLPSNTMFLGPPRVGRILIRSTVFAR